MAAPLKYFQVAPPSGDYRKYKYPLTKDIIYRRKNGKKILFRQVDYHAFAIVGLTKTEAFGQKEFLKNQLASEAPVDTGRLSKSYRTLPLELPSVPPGWAITIINNVWYFRFPFFWYIANKSRNFVETAVEKTVARIIR